MEDRRDVLICVVHVLLALNYSINFLLYCVGNKNVRDEAFQVFFRCKNIYWGDWQKGTLNVGESDNGDGGHKGKYWRRRRRRKGNQPTS